MAYKLRFRPVVRGAIGQCGLSRPGLVRLFEKLRERLESEWEVDKISHIRAPDDPDCFLLKFSLDTHFRRGQKDCDHKTQD